MQQALLRDLCTLRQWHNLPKQAFTAEGYPVYGANGIIGFTRQFNHEKPTIAITSRGDSCGNVIITKPFSYITANAICIENIHNAVLPQYLYYYLKSANLHGITSGAAQPQITQKNLGNVPILIPSLSYQQHVVNALQKVEQVINLRQQQLDALDLMRQSFYHQHFSALFDSEKQQIVPLEQIADIQCGKRNAGDATAEGVYPFFSCAKSPLRSHTYQYDCECVLLTGNIDFQVTYFDGKFDAYQRVYIIESRDKTAITVPYLYAFLQHSLPQIQQQAVGGTIKYIRRSAITRICIPLPAPSTQQIIGNFALRILQLKNKIQQATNKETVLFHSLLAQFFQSLQQRSI